MTKYNKEIAESFNSLGIAGTTDELVFAAFKRMVNGSLENSKVLDFGSGPGRSTQFLRTLNPALLVGAERDKDMIGEAKKAQDAGINYVRATGSEHHLPFRPNSFDVVFSSYVPCETKEREDLLRMFAELNRVLKPGGDCYIITLNPKAFGSNFTTYHYDKGLKVKSGDPITSYIHSDPPAEFPDTYWSMKTLKKIFRQTGFSIRARELPKATGPGWLDETRVAPDVLYHLAKPLTNKLG